MAKILDDKLTVSEQGIEVTPGVVRKAMFFLFTLIGLTLAMTGGLVSVVGVAMVFLAFGTALSMQKFTISKNGIKTEAAFSRIKLAGWPSVKDSSSISDVTLHATNVQGRFVFSSNEITMWPFNSTALFLKWGEHSVLVGFLNSETAKQAVEHFETMKSSL